MRINSVDNNTPRFKALKIHDNVKPLLENQSIEYIKNLKQLGIRLKVFKHIDLVYKGNLIPKIYNSNSKLEKPFDYYQELLREENCLGKFITVTSENETISGHYPEQPFLFIDIFGSKEAVERYNEFKKLNSNDKLVEFCRILNEKEEKRIAKELARNIEIEAKRVAVKAELEGLYDLYCNSEKTEPSGKIQQGQGFLTRLKNIFK